jgi:hypothetical protein
MVSLFLFVHGEDMAGRVLYRNGEARRWNG